MTEAILIFTFSPIQPFIAESRRAEDLFTASYILVQLATAAAEAIGKNYLIYPAPSDLGRDVPNRLVAKVPYDQAKNLAQQAEEMLLKRWRIYVKNARDKKLARFQPGPDAMWLDIWQRQTTNYWECYWAFAEYAGNYWPAYKKATTALDAVKRTRVFNQTEEKDMKDTLGGQRSALRLMNINAKKYWAAIANQVSPSKLRSDGKERLDAIGAVKRFGLGKDEYQPQEKSEFNTFPSVSSVAAADFLQQAKQHPTELRDYRRVIEALLDKKSEVRSNPAWPYDGDLFFVETLEANRLKDSYHLANPDPEALATAREALKTLHTAVKNDPTPYYALLQLDGDGMGEIASNEAEKGEMEHGAFSRQLSEFAWKAHSTVAERWGYPIYTGGDDVFALAPISTALQIGQALQDEFKTIGTLSAGVVIAHHLYPLHAALEAVHEAEKTAKNIDGKAAVTVRVFKRSGQTLTVRSKWQDIPQHWSKLVELLQRENSPLSSRLPHSVAAEAGTATDLDRDAQKAIFRRLMKRHTADKLLTEEAAIINQIEEQLLNWVIQMDSYIPTQQIDSKYEIKQGFAEMGNWLLLAHFLARPGGDD